MGGRLVELARLFVKLGVIGFGGPAAHIALMRREVVSMRRWQSDEEFLDLVGATNLIPGPNSTEMAIHVGRVHAGWRGLVVSGVSFIPPAVCIVLAVAWSYGRYGGTPAGDAILDAVAPVMIAIVAQALWRLGRTAVKDATTGVVGAAVFAAYLAGVHELVLLAAGGLAVLAVREGVRAGSPVVWLATGAAGAQETGGWTLALVFLKVGALLYGSGYVLLAFLERDLVRRLGWLTEAQLLDAIAVGQLTPGPVFTTATFVGYVVDGWTGAAIATVAIFLPSFAFVAALGPLIPRIRASVRARAFLDGVNAAAVGLMAGVTVVLARDAFAEPVAVAIGVAAAVVVFVTDVDAVWPIVAAVAVGVLRFTV